MSRTSLVVSGLVGALLATVVSHRSLLNNQLNKVLGVRETVQVDSPEFCAALEGRTTMFRQTVSGKIEIIIPAKTKEEAELFLMMRRAMLNRKDLSETIDEVDVGGCGGGLTPPAEEPAAEEEPVTEE
jgi:hypothetical protein